MSLVNCYEDLIFLIFLIAIIKFMLIFKKLRFKYIEIIFCILLILLPINLWYLGYYLAEDFLLSFNSLPNLLLLPALIIYVIITIITLCKED